MEERYFIISEAELKQLIKEAHQYYALDEAGLAEGAGYDIAVQNYLDSWEEGFKSIDDLVEGDITHFTELKQITISDYETIGIAKIY